MLLSTAESCFELPAPLAFVVVNEAAVGFYRTRYAPELLARLADDLGGRLSAIERFALVEPVRNSAGSSVRTSEGNRNAMERSASRTTPLAEKRAFPRLRRGRGHARPEPPGTVRRRRRDPHAPSGRNHAFVR